ncbi:Trp operon leader peptide [Vibrio sinensis]|uniref:Trp operon leader peptide n=1 Tax=Vibrio sinensis TaxID=2302434 RepID=A0A3A6QCT3_9VIBR|nr:Trp operon leader peptide [Vibrio sinensis]RJX69539.1 Trp operon leader peptide [Vibrio sinensis]
MLQEFNRNQKVKVTVDSSMERFTVLSWWRIWSNSWRATVHF